MTEQQGTSGLSLGTNLDHLESKVAFQLVIMQYNRNDENTILYFTNTEQT